MYNNFDDLIQKLHGSNPTKHLITDSEEAIQINGTTRTFIIPENYNTQIGTTNDYNSNELTFVCPQFIEKHDITQCTYKVLKWFNTTSRERGVVDLKFIETTDEQVTFTCIIPPEAMTHAGQIQIAVCFMDEVNGEIVYKWNSTICQALYIVQGLDQVAIKGTPLTRIVNVDLYNRALTLPPEFNTTIAHVGDVGTNKITFRTDRFLNDIDFKNAQLEIRWKDSSGEQKKSAVGTGAINVSLDGNEQDDWIEYEWVVPFEIAEVAGSISIVLSLLVEDPSRGLMIWNSTPFSQFVIGDGFEYSEVIPSASGYSIALVPEEELETLLESEFGYTLKEE